MAQVNVEQQALEELRLAVAMRFRGAVYGNLKAEASAALRAHARRLMKESKREG